MDDLFITFGNNKKCRGNQNQWDRQQEDIWFIPLDSV
jgi:hypothetical protein